MHPRFSEALASLPATLQAAVQPVIAAPDFAAFLTPEQVAQLQQQSGLDEHHLALALLPLAAACALEAVSHFSVGAIAHGKSGHWYFGANMEFRGVALQQTVHAEQSAITHAWVRGEQGLQSITVNYTPCGHCRQFMNELNSGLELSIRLPERAQSKLADYLPNAFGPRDLAVTTFLLDECNHGYLLNGEALDQVAIAAANRSHAPYSHAHSGVALLTKRGRQFSGSYAENAAFNPSLPPLQAALIALNLSGESIDDLQQAVLAESSDAIISQWADFSATLNALGCDNIARVALHKP